MADYQQCDIELANKEHSLLQVSGVERGCCWGNLSAKFLTALFYVGGRWKGMMNAGKACGAAMNFHGARAGNANSILRGWAGGVFIIGIRAYEISDDVTKFYLPRTVIWCWLDVISPHRVHTRRCSIRLNNGSCNTKKMFRAYRLLLLRSILLSICR